MFQKGKKKKRKVSGVRFLDIFSVGLLFESVFDIGNTR